MTWLENHWIDIFGWLGSALLIFSLLQTRVLRFRLLNLVGSVTLVIFNALLEVWPMVGLNVVTTVINLWFIARMLREQHDAAVFEVLQVGPRDIYLQHFLRVHESDIRKSQPGFAIADMTDEDLAFQVEKGDETVGVVVIRREGDVAKVLLDYVTLRFRDFSPGEFVWNRAPRLRERGFRKVVTPPDMVNPYYDRLPHGFRHEGASYVLDL